MKNVRVKREHEKTCALESNNWESKTHCVGVARSNHSDSYEDIQNHPKHLHLYLQYRDWKIGNGRPSDHLHNTSNFEPQIESSEARTRAPTSSARRCPRTSWYRQGTASDRRTRSRRGPTLPGIISNISKISKFARHLKIFGDSSNVSRTSTR